MAIGAARTDGGQGVKVARSTRVIAGVTALLLVLLLFVFSGSGFRDQSLENAIAEGAGEAGGAHPLHDHPVEHPAELHAAATETPAPEAAAIDPCLADAQQIVSALYPAAADETQNLPDVHDGRQRLLDSRDAEHLGAAALLADTSALRVESISQALLADRHNALLVWTAVRICSDAGDEVDCPLQEWEDELLRVDGQNAEAWIGAAVSRLERGETDAALAALQRASAAAETRVYWAETIEMTERALAAVGFSFPDRVWIAFSVASANMPRYSPHISMCTEQSRASSVWTEACLRYGRLAEQRHRTSLGRSAGQALQMAVLEATGDETARAEVAARREQNRHELHASVDRDDLTVDALIHLSPTHFFRYLAAFREYGEAGALELMREEADRVRRELGGEAC